MSLDQLEDLQVHAEGLLQQLMELHPGERAVAALPLLERLGRVTSDHALLQAVCGQGRHAALDAVLAREVARQVAAAAGATGDSARWRTALVDLRVALDAMLVEGDG
jgi:hypothetical protein